MPETQSEIQFAFEILPATLCEFAQVDTEQDADLLGAFTALLYGSEQGEVEDLLSGPVGRPWIPVTSRGVPALLDCWTRVLAAIAGYNAIGTGLALSAESEDPVSPPEPHCVKYAIVDGQVKLVCNYAVSLTLAGRTEPVYPLSAAAGVSRQVMAMGHAAISVPIQPPE